MRKLVAPLVVIALYVGSYLLFRHANVEVWVRDQYPYVIFPAGVGTVLYYVWRPLSYVDAKLTGMRFHIGPHQE